MAYLVAPMQSTLIPNIETWERILKTIRAATGKFEGDSIVHLTSCRIVICPDLPKNGALAVRDAYPECFFEQIEFWCIASVDMEK